MIRKLTILAVAGCVALAAAASWSAETDPGQRVVKVLRTTNKSQVTKFVTKVYDLKNVNPFNVVRWITRQVQADEGAFWTFAAPDQESGKILVVVPEHQIPSLDALMAAVDKPKLTSSSGTARAYVQLKHRAANDTDFVNALSQFMAFGSATVLTDRATNALYLEDTPLALADTLAALEEHFDVPTPEILVDATIYEVQANNDGSIGLDFAAWKNGPGRNLFALGAFGEYDSAHEYDIQIEDNDIGFDPNNNLIYDSGAGLAGLPGHRFSSTGHNIAYYLRVPSAYFDMLTVKGQARVVTKTRLSVLNRRQASISSGEQYFYYLTQNGPAPVGGIRTAGLALDPLGLTDYGSYPQYNTVPYPVTNADGEVGSQLYYGSTKAQNSYPDNRTVTAKTDDRTVYGKISGKGFERSGSEYTDTFNEAGQPVKISEKLGLAASRAGVFLDVVPAVGEDLITLALRYSVVNLTGYDGEGRPQLVARSDESTVRAKDGEEIVLGGLIREARVQQSSKVPVLGSLPIIGYLFGGESTTASRAMAVVVLKSEVVQNFSNAAGDQDMIAAVEDTFSPAGADLPKSEYGWDMYLFDRQERN